ncbi:hypothetical protein HYH03_001023 [Edaphochlamys debaryana]|uniref:Uncharacterized protein n=1 Tax=Edaphochlamys debaryana TaxID=47281 RepID=A0A835YE56_9CHLO|nr:hypothetical protein HYH03_001023 [Edaphochlamys debaryana]|eukprot:KAG2501210.1 hypothetical protein HYH03_001023 [Edaphochlamys debaryana]
MLRLGRSTSRPCLPQPRSLAPLSRRPAQRWARRSLPRLGVAAPGASDVAKADGPSTDLRVIADRLWKLGLPFWQEDTSARWKLAGVVGLTLATTGVSVVFNFLGRDFFTALSEKNEEQFKIQLAMYLGAFVFGIPVFVFKSYYQSKLALEWRQWMTERMLQDYLAHRTFYGLQQSAEVDNPDQRISSDVATFTDTAMGLSLTLFNALLDLISFSGILFTIYPPLFAALVIYSVGGTAASVALGKNLVTLNFNQEAREADFRYGLVRVRENAESIAFYSGETDEKELLKQRLQAAVHNYLGLLTASRNLDFFTSFYRYLIQLLPAAVVAPLFFQGKIDFGVINQSQSAFNHILNDVSLVIYRIETLAGFSAVIDRLGEFTEAMDARNTAAAASAAAAAGAAPTAALPATTTASTTITTASTTATTTSTTATTIIGADEPRLLQGEGLEVAEELPGIRLKFLGGGVEAAEGPAGGSGRPLLRCRDVAVVTPRGGNLLLQGLDLDVPAGSSLLVMGPSGAGKTSLLRAVAGLWGEGRGVIELGMAREEVMFLPQRPYMVLGSLRDQALYPRRRGDDAEPREDGSSAASSATSTSTSASAPAPPSRPLPSDEEILAVLETVSLGHLLGRYGHGNSPSHGHLYHAPSSAASSSAAPSATNGSATPSTTTSASSAPPSTPASTPSSPSSSLSSALDAVADWSGSLSLGEQQRLGWARLLLARPRLALLDEATSALDQETEAKLYKVLQRSGIAYVSVGHRSTLREFHGSLLRLKPDGRGGMGWEVKQLKAAAVAVAP